MVNANIDGSIQLRVHIDKAECYVAFAEERYPVLHACESDKQDINTMFFMIPSEL